MYIQPRPGFYLTKQFAIAATLPSRAKRRAIVDITQLRVLEAPDLAVPFAHLEAFDYLPVAGLLIRVLDTRQRLEPVPCNDVLYHIELEIENTSSDELEFESVVTLTGVAAREMAAASTRTLPSALTIDPMEFEFSTVGGIPLSIDANVVIDENSSAGADGEDGADGTVWRSGATVPSDTLGNDGDFYLDTATNDVYKRTLGVYAVIVNLKGAPGVAGTNGTNGTNGSNGADGAAGTVWRTGTGVPSNTLGVNGDLYLNAATGDVYQRTSGTYSIVANIKGAAGSGGGSAAVDFVSVYNTANQTGIASGGSGTNITWSAEQNKTVAGMHSNSTNTDRLIVVNAGWYDFGAIYQIDGLSGGAKRMGEILLNGTTVLSRDPITPTSNYVQVLRTFGGYYLNAGDYLTVRHYHDGSGTQTVYATNGGLVSRFWMKCVR